MHFLKIHFLRCINAVGCIKKRHAPRYICKMQAILSVIPIDQWDRFAVEIEGRFEVVLEQQRSHVKVECPHDFRLQTTPSLQSEALPRSTSIIPCICLKHRRICDGLPSKNWWPTSNIYLKKNYTPSVDSLIS